MKLKVVIVLAFYLIVCEVRSQTDFAWLGYTYLSKSDFADTTGKISLSSVDFSFIAPTIKLGKKTTFNNGLTYRLSHFDYIGLNATQKNFPGTIHDIRESIIVKHTVTTRWSLLFLPRINLRGDFEQQLKGKDIFPAFVFLATKTSCKNPNFKWGAGFNYNNDFAKNSIVPIVGLEYSTSNFTIKSLLPSNASFILSPNKRIEYGLVYYVEVSIFHLNKMVASTPEIQFLHTLNLFFSGLLSYRIAGKVWLNTRMGYALARNYFFFNQNLQSPSISFENKLSPSPFVLIGISIRTEL